MTKNIYIRRFSLVELLVMTAILFALISLLSPAIKSTIRSANNVACASNLKSLSILFETFAQDNDNEYLNNETLFKLNRYGELQYTTPMVRRSFKGWASDLLNYDEHIQNLVYCPADQSQSSQRKSTESNASVSYEFKSTLIDLSRNEFKRSVRTDQFGIPSRQSLLISRGTFHADKVKGHHAKYDTLLKHNLLFVDGHTVIDYLGYNHPNILESKMNWLQYPVYPNNKKARRNNDYLQSRCEVEESAL